MSRYDQQPPEHNAIIQHVNREWTTLFLEYTSTTAHTTSYKYTVKDNDVDGGGGGAEISGEFVMKNSYDFEGGDIGGRSDDTRFFEGEIVCYEACHKEDEQQISIPSSLRKLVIWNQMVKPPPDSVKQPPKRRRRRCQ